VHFEVPDPDAEPLARALRELAASGLHVVIAKGVAAPAPGARRQVRLDLVGQDRPGIVRELSGCLARRGVSIEELHTEFASAPMSAERLFKVKARLDLPEGYTDDELRHDLEALANEMMVGIEVGTPAGAVPDRA